MCVCVTGSTGRDTDGPSSGVEAASAAGAGVADRLPEQDQDADRGPAPARA